MKKIAILLTTMAMTATVAVGQTTQKFSATKANSYGLAYTLPVTSVDVTIEAEITVKKPGEFGKYATKYLNISDPILHTEKSVDLKSVTIATSGVADPDRRYLISLKSNLAPYIMLTEQGIPLSINSSEKFAFDRPDLPEPQAAEPTPLETDAARQAVTQEMLLSHSSAKRAQLAAEQIYALRQTRNDLITGQADQMPPDGQALKIILDNLNEQEAALMAMFVGTTSVSTQVKTFSFVPDDDIARRVICRLSAVDGIVEPSDLSGAPVYLELKVTERGQLPVDKKGLPLKFPAGGVAYCIPGTAEVSVSYDGRIVDKASVEMAQFGVVYGMKPSNFTSTKAPVYMLFDPRTGTAAEVGPAKLGD